MVLLNPAEIIGLMLINFVGVFVYAISSFGNAIIFHVLYKVVFCTHMLDSYIPNINEICSSSQEVILVVIYVSFGSLFIFPTQTWFQRKHLNWKLALHLCVSQQIGMYLGIYILFYVNSPWICRAMGFFFFAIAMEKTYSEAKLSAKEKLEKNRKVVDEANNLVSTSLTTTADRINEMDSAEIGPAGVNEVRVSDKKSDGKEVIEMNKKNDIHVNCINRSKPEDKPLTRSRHDSVTGSDYVPYTFDSRKDFVIVWFTGIASGIFAGLFASGGPPLMWFVSQVRLHSAECRATFSFYFSLQNIIRCIYIVFFQKKIIVRTLKFLIIFILLTVNSACALYVGNKMAKNVDAAIFRKIIISLLVFGAVFIGISGCSPSEAAIAFTISFIIYFIFAYFSYRKYQEMILSPSSASSNSSINLNNTINSKDLEAIDKVVVSPVVVSPYHALISNEDDGNEVSSDLDESLRDVILRERMASIYRQNYVSISTKMSSKYGHNNGGVTTLSIANEITRRQVFEESLEVHIRSSRGIFHFLPVKYSSDLVHGSWWYVWGSLLSALIPLVPLIDLYFPFFYTPPDSILQPFHQKATWLFSIFSGIMFTLGSYAYLRAFEDPPVEALFPQYRHFSTDELLGSWLFFLAVVPSIPGSIICLYSDSSQVVYWGYLIGSIISTTATAGLVKNSYPMKVGCHTVHEETKYIYHIFKSFFGEDHWILRHVSNDWLASCWFFFISGIWGTLLCNIFLFFQSNNDRQLYIWVSGWIDSVLFLIGSAYFVAGSYPHHQNQSGDQNSNHNYQITKK